MATLGWRRRRGLASIGEVLDRGAGKRLVGRQRVWRQLVGRALGEMTALVDLTDDGALRVMARNDAVRREVLARSGHIVASWNVLAKTRHAPLADTLVCWVNPRVGRTSENAPEIAPSVDAVRAEGAVEAAKPAPEDDDITAIFERIRAKRDAASRKGPDAP